MANQSCANCGATLETPLACGACGHLAEPPEGGSFDALGPYTLFGLEVGYELDTDELRKRLLRLSRLVHPDFFVTAGAELRQRAEEASAALNGAHEVLADEVRRADWLVRHLGGPSEADERQMPQVFLMEVLEWNEALQSARESAPGSSARAALGGLSSTLEQERESSLESVRKALSPLPDRDAPALLEARRQLNAIRYVDRALREIEALRLEEAASR